MRFGAWQDHGTKIPDLAGRLIPPVDLARSTAGKNVSVRYTYGQRMMSRYVTSAGLIGVIRHTESHEERIAGGGGRESNFAEGRIRALSQLFQPLNPPKTRKTRGSGT
jgi:hypothetical protein